MDGRQPPPFVTAMSVIRFCPPRRKAPAIRSAPSHRVASARAHTSRRIRKVSLGRGLYSASKRVEEVVMHVPQQAHQPTVEPPRQWHRIQGRSRQDRLRHHLVQGWRHCGRPQLLREQLHEGHLLGRDVGESVHFRVLGVDAALQLALLVSGAGRGRSLVEYVGPVDTRRAHAQVGERVWQALMLLTCWMSRGCRLCFRWGCDDLADLAGSVSLEAADGFAVGFAFGDAAGEVVAGMGIPAQAG